MPSQGPNNGSSFTNLDTDNTWTNTTYAQYSDDQRTSATAARIAPYQTGRLLATGFGFSIPSDATIEGVVVQVEGYGQVTGNWYAQLYHAGTAIGTAKSASFGASEAVATLGSSTDTWGATLSPSTVNDSSFGVAVRAVFSSSSREAYIDHITMTVYYALPDTGGFFYQSVII